MKFSNFSVYVSNNQFIMNFQANKHYYIHNKGINFQQIFFSNEHRMYFKKKIKTFISPYAKIISIKLADNQFHILIKTKKDYQGQFLNHNIGIMLRSYTRAINKQRLRFGSLFTSRTKAFEKLSDIPKRLRGFIKPFVTHFSKGNMVNFEKTITSFLSFLQRDLRIGMIIKFKSDNLDYQKIFDHPFKDELTNIKI